MEPKDLPIPSLEQSNDPMESERDHRRAPAHLIYTNVIVRAMGFIVKEDAVYKWIEGEARRTGRVRVI